MSDGTGYHAWYNAHPFDTVRLPRPKPFAARILLREDDIGTWREDERKRDERKEGGAVRLKCGTWREEGGGALYFTAVVGEAAAGHWP
jgi:hypothetical protein